MRRLLPFGFVLVPLALSVAAGCDQAGNELVPLAPPPPDDLPSTCSPLRAPGSCMTPWPNAVFLAHDPTTATGYRLALESSTLPVVEGKGTAFDPTRWNRADGFSPAGSMLVYFTDPIDPVSLVPEDDIAASLKPGAGTALVDMSTGQLVAHFSGVDENANLAKGQRQAVIITPASRLLPDHRYAVAVTTSARVVPDGDAGIAAGPPPSPPSFQAMLNGAAAGDPLSQAELARLPAIVAALAKAGIAQSQLVVAWDFVTGSDTALTAPVLSMRDQALTEVGPEGGAYTVVGVDENLDATTLRRIRGTFTVPQFIDNADETKPEAQLTFDSAGNPVLLGTYQAPFTVIIPAAAATKHPLPIVVYGHGIFGSGEGELGDASGSFVQDFANAAGVVVVATDWIGLSTSESPLSSSSNGALADVLTTQFSNLPWITDRLQQSLVNTMVLVRTMRSRIASDPAMTVTGHAGGAPVADPSVVRYWGVSLGGIMGLSFMGYDPDVTTGVLTSGGGFWSTLLPRSYAWAAAGLLTGASYPDKLDDALLVQLAQMQFDFSDPATVAPYVLRSPLRGVPPKTILAQMGLYDSMVANVASEMIARTEGLPLLSPAVTAPFGPPPTPGPLSSGLSTWNVDGMPRPADTNLTPSTDNLVHEAVRRIPQVQQQIQTFWASGRVVDTCGGRPCNEPVPPGTPMPTLP
jgi:hypothetical protein